ncbi:carboxypeptidase [Mesorhizobium sp. M2D.F.Ca.ET.223.01.1.1]|uniref:carboxypeptidase n=1 Tax=Mesorhizobium sp. M2D.F.Ca.ET.223.01.1.1 TaxID=2563940 RepID=UPI00109281E7|nr:carboxypeptidase [Mesorhizobium sp. M2D.F.Ca.ET.223.01.1.1]TGR84601.1 carboxypeptidase [Mesorhizobium sp. M2D.F.Ca.ET.223.01.1.1]TGT64514.1 carboxypeptidase [bacterium M00.F.Ca.ET.159.01.1.1]TGT79359.1 carboxypeptidase [bacterium M00.F.Ca.ET.157.01.1.1]
MDLNLGDTRLIVAECKKHGLLRNQAAYCLATCWHESAHTMKPVREYGGEAYLKSKPYYPYVGMGYVQLTWKANYRKASGKVGVDLVASPQLALDPQYAAPILVIGMQEGWFTGKKLSDYITLQSSDFTNARRIVNGTDKAAVIAGYAKQYDALLQADGYGADEPVQPVNESHPSIWSALIKAILAIFGKKAS